MDAWRSAVRLALRSLLPVSHLATKRPQDHTQDSANHTTGALLWGPRVTGNFCFSAREGNSSLAFRHTAGNMHTFPKCPEDSKGCLFFLDEVLEHLKAFALFICFLKQDLM